MKSLRHLVVGTDFSACSESALECAITLANLGLARITVVHVCELESRDPDDAIWKACSERLAAVVERHRRCGVEVRSLLRTGKPWEKLNNAATEVGASLIVVGRHGARAGNALGSIAHKVLGTATRPVLVVGLGGVVLTAAGAR